MGVVILPYVWSATSYAERTLGKQRDSETCEGKKSILIKAVVQRCSIKSIFLEISESSQENACARVSFLIQLQASGLAQVFSCKFCEISKNTFVQRTPLVAASVLNKNQ